MCEVFLRKIRLEDTENIVRWRNSLSVRKYLYSQEELRPEQHISYFNNVVSAGKCVQYIIVVKENDICTDIGTTFIKNIDYHNKKGEFGIFIGEETARGRGYAKFAVNAILEIAFKEMLLNRVYLSVMSNNEYAIRTYKKAGFAIEGVLKEDFLSSEGYVDVVIMGLTQKDYKRKNI